MKLHIKFYYVSTDEAFTACFDMEDEADRNQLNAALVEWTGATVSSPCNCDGRSN